ncbi:MAG: DNRLRE domain-containing protein [Kiritimatiellae bacterium]|nr:DNRLRE domain-containing protein [Kiritimatiellia bacterium]
MNCQECEALFDDMLDRKVCEPLRRRMDLHLTRCGCCRDALERRRRNHVLLFRTLNSPKCTMHLPDGFADRLVAECNRPQSRWGRLALPRWALVAASLVVVAGFVFAAAVGLRLADLAGEGEETANPGAGQFDAATPAGDAGSAAAAATPTALAPSARTSDNQTNQGEEGMNIKQLSTAAALAAAMLSSAPPAAANGGESRSADPSPLASADGEWSARLPLQDTFVRDTDPNANFGKGVSIIAGNNRESCMMLDVSGLANVTAARIRFYVTQAGTAAGVKYPLYFRVMRNDRWNENTLTWNSMRSEFLVPAPVLATNDVTLAGYAEVPTGTTGTWQEVDVTAAVKAAAPRGRLSLHIYTPRAPDDVEQTPLSIASVDNPDESLRPVLEFQGPVDASAPSLTLLPTDDAFIEAGHADINYGVSNAGNGGQRYTFVLVGRNSAAAAMNREGLLKFDLSGIGAERVDSAVLLLRMAENQSNHTTGNTVQFQLTENTSWSESVVTWNNVSSTVGITPGSAWPTEMPANAVRAGSADTNVFYTVELAPLVNQVLAAGKTRMALRITMQYDNPAYFLFYSKECENVRWRPRLLVSPKVDAALTTRKPVQETFVSDYSEANKDKSFYDVQGYVQIGYRQDMVAAQYATMLFDPSGLENAERVRFRVRAHNTIMTGNGVLRVCAWMTDGWNETNLTWNTVAPWFPQPNYILDGTILNGEIANIGLTQGRADLPYFEVDVTAAARAAALAGRMLTLGLFSQKAWPEFYKGASDYPAWLIFPDPDAAFGNRATASLEMGGATPALRLTWSPSPAAGATYKVERMQGGRWEPVATGLSEATCLDAGARPYETHTYRITVESSGESVTKSVDFHPEVKVFACADTYVRNGSFAGTSYGTDAGLVHKYEYGEGRGSVREALCRFDLSEVPEKFKTARLVLYPTGAGGHGGMDFLMDLRWVHCLRNGLPLDMDVYDLASWSCLCELTEKSQAMRGAPVDVPDFTRGAWKTMKPLGIVTV